jgi:GNAT superfamily N-acetyltransferase
MTAPLSRDHELELNKANRLRLASAFRDHKRVDLSIDCVIEGQMGRAFVDDPASPSAYRISIGPFWYLAGEARCPGGYQMARSLPAYNLLMSPSAAWLEVVQEAFTSRLHAFPRYSYSSSGLSAGHLGALLERTGYQERVIAIDENIASALTGRPESFLELSDYDSIPDFLERGLGFTMLDGDKVMGVAYSSLVCSQGIEVSIYVEERYRRQGVATALGARLLQESLRRNLRPDWDAANLESRKLAEKLGFKYVETYNAYYHPA